jgi:hypothetical protein
MGCCFSSFPFDPLKSKNNKDKQKTLLFNHENITHKYNNNNNNNNNNIYSDNYIIS